MGPKKRMSREVPVNRPLLEISREVNIRGAKKATEWMVRALNDLIKELEFQLGKWTKIELREV